MTDVIMHTIGIISIVGAIISLLSLWAIMTSFEVKYLKAKVTLKPHFWIPFIGSIFYTVWLIIG